MFFHNFSILSSIINNHNSMHRKTSSLWNLEIPELNKNILKKVLELILGMIQENIMDRSSMPFPLASFCLYFHWVKYFNNFSITKILGPQLDHFRYIFILFLNSNCCPDKIFWPYARPLFLFILEPTFLADIPYSDKNFEITEWEVPSLLATSIVDNFWVV